MDTKVIKKEKNLLIVQLGNKTIAEILRVYLNKDSSVELAAWKRDNPGKPIHLEIQTKGKDAKKALDDAAAKVEKDLSKFADEFNKAK